LLNGGRKMPITKNLSVFMLITTRTLLLALPLLLAGCDLEALLADPKVVQREADAKAIGSACRHGLRSIEDCYAMNEKASKASVFAGWKEMDQYMRDNKIEGVEAKGLKPTPPPMVASDEEIVDTPGAPKADKPTPEGKKTAKTEVKPAPKVVPKAESKAS
jgi:hypothetical protein